MTTSGRSWTRVRDIARGKHHLSKDQQVTLCGREVYGFWHVEQATRWSDEDQCRNCTRLSDAASDRGGVA